MGDTCWQICRQPGWLRLGAGASWSCVHTSSHAPRIHEQKSSKVSNGLIRRMKQTEGLTYVTRLNGWEPAVSHELHDSKFRFVSRIEFIRSNLWIFFSAHVRGVTHTAPTAGAHSCSSELEGQAGRQTRQAIGGRLIDQPLHTAAHTSTDDS